MPTALLGAFGGGGLFSGLLGKIISFAISSIFQSLFAPDEPERQEPESEGPLLNKRSNTSSIPVVYGTRRIGGNRVFVATDGTKNDTLHIVLLVSEGEIDGFQDIYLDDTLIRFTGKTEGVGTFADGTVHKAIGARERQDTLVGNEFPLEDTDTFKDLAEFTFHNGALNQSADGGLSGVQGWSSSHKLQGRSYIYAKLTYDQDTFSSIPNITANIRGKKVAPISGSTIDDTLTNAAYSENPALCLRDYLTNADYGRGLDTATIDDSKMIDAANYCDESIGTDGLGLRDAAGTILYSGSRYTMNGIVKTNDTLYSNTQSILTNMRGFLVFSSGTYKLILDKAETSKEHTYDESNIIGSLDVALGTKKNTLNRMRATFWNPKKNGEDDTVIIDEKTTRDALDNGVVLSRELQLPYCNSPHTARYLMNQEIEQSRQQIKITFTTGLAGLRNEIGDIIRVQHAQMGWGYRPVVVDGDVVLVKNSVITIGNLGQTGLIENWDPTDNYAKAGKAVSYQGAIFTSITANNLGNTPPTPTDGDTLNQNTDWKQAKTFKDIINLSQFGIIDADDDGENDTNIGVDGKFIYKEFRILSLSLKEEEEVELTCIEYDATVFDQYPLTLVDATPNTSFQNPNKIGPPSSLTTTEDLYVTTNSGGVKAALTLNWESPNTPFVQAYDVFVHIPEQTYSATIDYPIGTIVTFNDNRFESIAFNGPTGTTADPNNTSFWAQIAEIRDQDYVYLTRTRTQSATVFDAVPGNYAVRIKSVSVTGVRSIDFQSSTIPVLGLIAPPGNVTGFGITPQSDLALLQWDAVGDLDVRIGGQVQVRHSPGELTTQDPQAFWAAAPILTEGKSGVTTQILVPLLTGTYMIKALDSSGVESVTPSFIVNTIEPSTVFEFIRRYQEEPSWVGILNPGGGAGTSTGVEKFGDVLRLNTNGGTIVGSPPVTTTGTYNFGQIIEFSSVTETKLNSDIRAQVFNVNNLIDSLGLIDDLGQVFGNENVPDSSLTLEVSTTEDDPSGTPMWSPYIQFTSGIFNFRAARFRLIMTTLDLTTQVSVSEASVSASAAAVTQSSANLRWTAADVTAGFKDVTYSAEFFNDSDIGSFADPFLGISADGLVPGQYFTLSNDYNDTAQSFCEAAGGTYAGTTCSITDTGAPKPWVGFRIKFQQVGTTDVAGNQVLIQPNTGDGLVPATENIQFDYRSTGF